MPYRWRTRIEVDEAVVAIMNSLQAGGNVPEWLIRTSVAAARDSAPALGTYFFDELERYAPRAINLFKNRAI